MNQKRRVALNEAFEELQSLIEEERETLDNQEEHFSETNKWQEGDEACSQAESALDDLEESFITWEIR